MDFERVLKTLLTEFEHQHIRYAAMGGFAMGAWGAGRMTRDLDFLVNRDDVAALHDVLSKLGYERFNHDENLSQYRHHDARWVGLDFIHAFRTAARDMLTRAKPYPVFQGTASIPVLEAEDVIGLKVQAIANNPQRRGRDQDDIERLMELHRDRLDWPRIQAYYDLFELGEEGRRLHTRFGHAQ